MVLGRVLAGALCGLALLTSAGWADEPASARVGRISAVSGAVQYRSAGVWSAALLNESIAADIGVRTPRGASAELRVGDSRLALDGGGELQIFRLDGDATQIGLPQGRLFVHLAAGNLARTAEVDLPGGGVWLAAPGEYDITAGDAHERPRIEVFSGQAMLGGGLEDSSIAAATPDTFDAAWRNESDSDDDTARVPAGITGAEMLAANGDWARDPTYGDVWYPKDPPVNWAPFRYGVWRYLPPWGWTWVDAAAWGFAPSHYGAWVRLDGRWAWAPGSQHDDAPAYSPAVVGFLGTPGIGLSRPGNDGAAVAWFPLPPSEPASAGAVMTHRHAASIVPRAVFASGKPVQAMLLDLPEWRLDDAPVIAGALNIAPVGDGATAFVATAEPEPVVPAHVAVVTPVEKPPAPPPVVTAQARAKQMLVAHIHDVLMHAARKKLSRAAVPTSHRWRAAEAAPVHAHLAPSTTATASTHNRAHLAAARGGVN